MKPEPRRRPLANDRYVIRLGTTNFTERYYRDRTGWVKISARGRKFRLTAEQVLNHLLPAFAGIKPNLIIQVEYTAAAKARSAPAPAQSQKHQAKMAGRNIAIP